MSETVTDGELTYRAVSAVASQFTSKPNPIAHARTLLSTEPQLWAAAIAEYELRTDGFRVTQRRKDIIWRALGGAAA